MKCLSLEPTLYQYLLDVSLREDDVLRRLREETARMPRAQMQISPDQGQFMAFLVRLMRARRCLEIGVFTGYSALSVARALPADGSLIACDVDPEWTAIARRYWSEAGVTGKIDLRLAPALETMTTLVSGFDFIFIDADKENYDAYYERGLELLRTGGLMLFDNVLWGGAVADPAVHDLDTVALRKLNRKLHKDERVDLSMLAVADGLTLIRKR